MCVLVQLTRSRPLFGLLVAAFEDSRIDSSTLSKADLLQQVAATQQMLNTAWALQSARLAQAGADVITRTPRLVNRVGTGEVEPAKLAAIHRALGRVSRVTEDGLSATQDLAAQVEAALLGDPEESITLEQGNTDLLARSSAPLIACRTSAS